MKPFNPVYDRWILPVPLMPRAVVYLQYTQASRVLLPLYICQSLKNQRQIVYFPFMSVVAGAELQVVIQLQSMTVSN